MQAYLDLINDAFLRSGQRLGTFETDYSYLTLDVVNQATRHFRDAAMGRALLCERYDKRIAFKAWLELLREL